MSGRRRALLIGCQTHGLEGVEGDVERMSQALAARRFELTLRTGPAATRDGILASYEQLITSTEPDDAVCIYYSGHGGRIANRLADGPRFLQYLVPTDHGPGSFRGVMSFELSLLLVKLTNKTPNVTVILDCCHAGQMSRGTSAAPSNAGPKLLAKAVTDDLSEQQLLGLLSNARALGALTNAESNPHALRLLATEPQVSAYEEKRDGVAGGIFTKALLAVLAERGGRRSSYGSLMLQVRELVMQRKAEQRPDVEGPRRRLLFELEQLPDERPLSLFFEGTDTLLRGGALLGAVPGSRFGVMPAGSEKYSAETALGEAIVTDSLGSTSRVELRAAEQRTLPFTGLLAFPLSVPFQRCRVGLGPELSPELGGLIADNRYVTPEAIQPGTLLPTVRKQGAELWLRDGGGILLLRTPETNPGPLLDRLECLARAEDLRAFPQGTLKVELQIELGRVEKGQCLKAAPGEPHYVGDRQYITVVNTGYDKRFVAVLGIDPLYTVRLLSRRAPRGQVLRPDQALSIGQSPTGAWLGLAATWPEGLLADAPLLESVLVIATDDEQDFSLLTTSDAYDLKLAHQGSAELDPERSALRGERAAREPRTPRSEYALTRIDYPLIPRPRSD